VLLIDADLRRPRVHKAFGLDSGVGATSVLVRESSLEEAAQATEIPGLHVLPCGPVPPNPSELLHGAGFEALLARASELYDRVIFDSPPLGAVTDAAVLAPQLGGVILVLRAGRTTRDALRSARRQLRDVSANILGTVVNDVDLSARRYGYGGYSQYYRQYGYYGSPEPTDRDEGSVEDAAE
ncbi:MAG: CpsD/CapB family tyrosine-protein kinase, partial [Myxococcales bacterium]|nr:CpsD/CapB family tyrosine-protein kinase [Myxococcales bacterium]